MDGMVGMVLLWYGVKIPCMCDPQPLFLSTEALAWRYGMVLPASPAGLLDPVHTRLHGKDGLLKHFSSVPYIYILGYYGYAPLYGFQSRT